MFIDIQDTKENQIITVNKNHIVCIGKDTAYDRYKTMIELVNGKLIFTNDILEDVQKLCK